jgi:hypothetical protein
MTNREPLVAANWIEQKRDDGVAGARSASRYLCKVADRHMSNEEYSSAEAASRARGGTIGRQGRFL